MQQPLWSICVILERHPSWVRLMIPVSSNTPETKPPSSACLRAELRCSRLASTWRRFYFGSSRNVVSFMCSPCVLKGQRESDCPSAPYLTNEAKRAYTLPPPPFFFDPEVALHLTKLIMTAEPQNLRWHTNASQMNILTHSARPSPSSKSWKHGFYLFSTESWHHLHHVYAYSV